MKKDSSKQHMLSKIKGATKRIDNLYNNGFYQVFGEKYNIREIAFDRWGAVQMVQSLENMGFNVVAMGQGFVSMSPPTKELMKLTLEQKIAHGGHLVLRWNMDNIFIRTDPALWHSTEPSVVEIMHRRAFTIREDYWCPKNLQMYCTSQTNGLYYS